MKLEPKHIIPYLLYGLPARLSEKGVFNLDLECPNPDCRRLGIIKNFQIWNGDFSGAIDTPNESFDFEELDEIEIALRPLSDLTPELYWKLSKENPKHTFGYWVGKDKDGYYFYFQGYSSRTIRIENTDRLPY